VVAFEALQVAIIFSTGAGRLDDQKLIKQNCEQGWG